MLEFAMDAAAAIERRQHSDRRRRPSSCWSVSAFPRGRRRGARREAEREGSYVDLYNPVLLFVVLLVVVLNVLDGFFTLRHLSFGGREANPVARLLIQWGPGPFLFIKCLGTGAALAFLCIHKNFRLGRAGLAFSLGLYAAIFGYHLVLARDLL